MSEKNKAIIEKVNAAFGRGDVEAFLAHCHDDFMWTMVGEQPLRGKDAIRKFMAAGPKEPPKFTVNTVVADGDFVIAQGDMTMTDAGATNAYAFCDMWRFDGDKIAELKAFVIKTQPATV